MLWAQIRFYYIHFNSLPKQSITQFFQNPLIHQKRQNEVLRGNMNMNVSPKSGNYAIGRTPIFSASIGFKLLITQTEPSIENLQLNSSTFVA